EVNRLFSILRILRIPTSRGGLNIRARLVYEIGDHEMVRATEETHLPRETFRSGSFGFDVHGRDERSGVENCDLRARRPTGPIELVAVDEHVFVQPRRFSIDEVVAVTVADQLIDVATRRIDMNVQSPIFQIHRTGFDVSTDRRRAG